MLVSCYKNRVASIVAGHLPQNIIEEISQDAFIEIYKSLSNFHFPSPFEHWLSKITIRTCYRYWKKQKQENKYRIEITGERHGQWLEECLN